jgi:glutaredoxin
MKKGVLTVFTMETCPNCPSVKKMCEQVANEMELEFKVVDIKKDPLEGLMYQVMETPSIALNDEAIFLGEKPTRVNLIKELKRSLE